MEIQAAVTEAKGAPFEIQSIEIGELGPDEILVEIRACGVCHTDLIVRDQWYPVPLPAVLGHEGAGTVSSVGSAVSSIAVGDRVAMSFDSCGHCPTCLTGRTNYCHQFFEHNFGASRLDGSTALSRGGEPIHSHFFGQSAFATHAIASENNVVKLPDDVPFELVAPFGCGIQTGAGAIINTLAPPAGSKVAVFGTGAVGLSAIMAARIVGATTIIGIDMKPARLALARELGATHTIDASTTNVAEELAGITGAGVDFSLETTGVPSVLRTAVEATVPTGETGIVGAPPFGAEVALDVNSILVTGRRVRGIVEGDSVPQLFIPKLIELWRQGRFPVERLITTYDFDQIETAAHDAEAGDAIKPVLLM